MTKILSGQGGIFVEKWCACKPFFRNDIRCYFCEVSPTCSITLRITTVVKNSTLVNSSEKGRVVFTDPRSVNTSRRFKPPLKRLPTLYDSDHKQS